MTDPLTVLIVGGSIGVVILYLLLRGIASHEKPSEDEDTMTNDETDIDIDAMSRLINELPTMMQVAIAEGTLSLNLRWEEVTRDDDGYPTIKPRLVLTPINRGVTGVAATA